MERHGSDIDDVLSPEQKAVKNPVQASDSVLTEEQKQMAQMVAQTCSYDLTLILSMCGRLPSLTWVRANYTAEDVRAVQEYFENLSGWSPEVGVEGISGDYDDF